MARRGQETQFIFVGGPALKEKRGPIRSKVLQRARREKVDQQRSAAAAEINALLNERKAPVCTCYRESDPLESCSSALGYRQLRPKLPVDPRRLGTGQFCSFCGKSVRDRRLLNAASIFGIGAGNCNPMLSIDETASEFNVHEILHFATTAIWPNFRSMGYTAKCYQSWAVPYNDKVMLYALLWSASYHKDVLRLTYGPPDYQTGSRAQLRLKGLALEALQAAISTYTGTTPIDSIIMCILYLAVNDQVTAQLQRDPSPFTPVFTGLHSLDLYGSRDYHTLHWTVVQDLLGKFGGIQSLRAFALAWLISLADIMRSAHTLQKPVYPPMGVNNEVVNLDSPLVLFASYGDRFANFGNLAEKPGSGFNELLSLKPPVKQELVTTFADVGELSHILRCFSEEACSPNTLDLLGDSRDLVHHRLFSLPNENDPTGQILQLTDEPDEAIARSRKLYFICRLTAILYANHVTYPIPRTSIVRGPLLQSLCPRLQSLADQGATSPLLLWCTSVVVIALDVKDSSDPMMIFFRKLCRDLKITNLKGLLKVLRSFAWMDIAVEHHYRGMWKDLRQSDYTEQVNLVYTAPSVMVVK